MRKEYKCPRCGHIFKVLRPSEKRILKLLEGNSPLGFNELKRETGLSPPALSEALRFLVTEHFIIKDGSYLLPQ